MTNPAQSFTIRDFELQCGAVLPTATVLYQTYGELRGDRANAILYPTSYGAQHTDIDWLIGPERILDPTRWFIIIPNQLGNGLSTSPSNDSHCGLAENGFWFTHYDNLRAQEQLLRETWGIERLALVYGWSMGAQQAYYWGAHYPDRVERIAALCGTAKTTEHNQIFLWSLRSALTADPAWNGSCFEGVPDRGYRAYARIYASWAASQPYYRERIYRQFGYDSLEDYLQQGWEDNYRRRDPHDLIAMIDTWLRCDVSDTPIFQGNYSKALSTIQAQTLVMPATTDLYFTPDDCANEAAMIPRAVYRPIPSIWGHRAGNPYQNPDDESFIRQSVSELLKR
ncbi:alpha/beta fold hydrolase [Oscillatoria sp. CS-180]|uniref:alpha/beta fold hydrolase n=1 Tax=Oscillatoria sp. CS-180 TaxID=3021720 RepID=UPI00232CD780|nr:alpha/beta fold hydrolase [Oscillatoria sp. CS-180]MDB9529003.1 alpha/beta fold hydrolase [Oscillatoria sp. CS-180]